MRVYRAGTLYLALVQRSVILSGSVFNSRWMLHIPTPITAFYFPERVERIERTFANTVCGMTFSRFVRVLPFFFSCLSTLLIHSISDASPQNVYHRLAGVFWRGGVGVTSRLGNGELGFPAVWHTACFGSDAFVHHCTPRLAEQNVYVRNFKRPWSISRRSCRFFFYKDIISLLTFFSFSIAIASAHDAEVARPMNDSCIQQEASSFKRDVIGKGSLYRRTPSCAVKTAARGEARVLYWATVEIRNV